MFTEKWKFQVGTFFKTLYLNKQKLKLRRRKNFRIQGTLLPDGINNKKVTVNTSFTIVNESETLLFVLVLLLELPVSLEVLLKERSESASDISNDYKISLPSTTYKCDKI